MANIITNSQHYTDIANAIRNKNGEATQYYPSEMADAIKNIFSDIIVTAPTGSTVYIENQDGKRKDTGEKNGVWTFKGCDVGTWTVHFLVTGAPEKTKTVPITEKNQMLRYYVYYFAAEIGTVWPAGSTCTCSKGGIILTAPDTSGSYVFTVHEAGEWAVYCSDESTGQNTIKTVSITEDGQHETVELTYRLYLFKEGSGEQVSIYRNSEQFGSSSINDNYISFSTNGSYSFYSTIRTGNTVDISDYTKFAVEIEVTQFHGCVIAASKTAWIASNSGVIEAKTSLTASDVATRSVVYLDVSNLSGNYYVGLHAATFGKVYNMYLE